MSQIDLESFMSICKKYAGFGPTERVKLDEFIRKADPSLLPDITLDSFEDFLLSVHEGVENLDVAEVEYLIGVIDEYRSTLPYHR